MPPSSGGDTHLAGRHAGNGGDFDPQEREGGGARLAANIHPGGRVPSLGSLPGAGADGLSGVVGARVTKRLPSRTGTTSSVLRVYY